MQLQKHTANYTQNWSRSNPCEISGTLCELFISLVFNFCTSIREKNLSSSKHFCSSQYFLHIRRYHWKHIGYICLSQFQLNVRSKCYPWNHGVSKKDWDILGFLIIRKLVIFNTCFIIYYYHSKAPFTVTQMKNSGTGFT